MRASSPQKKRRLGQLLLTVFLLALFSGVLADLHPTHAAAPALVEEAAPLPCADEEPYHLVEHVDCPSGFCLQCSACTLLLQSTLTSTLPESSLAAHWFAFTAPLFAFRLERPPKHLS